jgi:hypothetical protein
MGYEAHYRSYEGKGHCREFLFMKPKRHKEELWVVKCPTDYGTAFFQNSFSDSRPVSVKLFQAHNFMDDCEWKDHLRAGYRCVKVKVEEI